MAATTTGELIGVGGRRGRGIEWGFASFSSLQTHLRHGRQKRWDLDQIVRDGAEDKDPFDQVAPTMPGLSQAANRLDQVEGLFDPLSLDHADGVARMAGRPTIDRRAAIGVLLRDMWSAAAFAAAGDEVGSIALSSIMSSAVACSAVPLASVSLASTMRLFRFSTPKWPM
jgi:hypothetical protein